MKLRSRLPELRARHGRLTLRRLAVETGIALSTLSRFDSGKSQRLDYDTVLTLCRHFRIHPGQLFEIEFDPGEESFNELAAA